MRPYLLGAGIEPRNAAQEAALAELLRERLSVLEEAPQRAAFLGADPELAAVDLVPKRLTAATAATILRQARPLLADLPVAGEEHRVEEQLRELARVSGVKFGDLMMTIRLAATGSGVSPPLFGSLRLLGSARVQERLARAAARLGASASEG